MIEHVRVRPVVGTDVIGEESTVMVRFVTSLNATFIEEMGVGVAWNLYVELGEALQTLKAKL